MRLTTIVGAIFATFAAQAVAQSPGNCSDCRSPTGCPGLCVQSDGQPFCKGYCGSTGMSPCSACAGQDNGPNCYYDTSGENCYLEIF